MQGSQLPFINQIKLLHKEYEMFEGCIEVSFFAEFDDLTEMLVIDMCVYSEKTL